MKLLLDEHLPHRLRLEIPGHEVFTVAYMGWSGVENGELLQKAAAERFDVLITNDRAMQYDRNTSTLPIAVIVIGSEANTIESIRPRIPQLLAAIARIGPHDFLRL